MPFLRLIRQTLIGSLDTLWRFIPMAGIFVISLLALAVFVSALGPVNAQQPPIFQAGAQQGVHGQESFLLILDSSDSMSEPLGNGQSKMAAAKRVILETMQKIPQEVPVGLRVYGDSTYNACRATRMLVPIAPNNRYQISAQMTKIRPTGMTPISYALTTAVREDFNMLNGKRNIILVSDGMETCDRDPCDLAVSMVQNGVDVKINVIGYGLREVEGIRQLKCAALATKGKFYNVDTSAQLGQSLDQILGAKKDVQAKIYIPRN
ncbi:MAG: VWA domain-containing protein [Vampirovibrionales bacterium]|nr:VWA domain-containing protein [Vampirovibrionales bacterium]